VGDESNRLVRRRGIGIRGWDNLKDDTTDAVVTGIYTNDPFERIVRKVEEAGIAESLFESLELGVVVMFPSTRIPFKVLM